MKPFHTIAIPHRDIFEGRLQMNEFAADLWQVYNNQGSDEYRDAQLFFQRTYMTNGLKNLINRVEKRIKGEGGDPTIQIQTPFGGGKTHSLIALLHKAKEWNINVAVLVGTEFDPKEKTLWEELEKQLTGNVELLKGRVSPGKEKLRALLSKKEPLLILMDEVIQFITKASGVKIGDSNLASQTISFMQELSELVGNLERTSLIITLPASSLEFYDENAEKLSTQLQKVIGRVEKILSPVEEHEISKVIRQRLFSSINNEEAKKIVNKFVSYLEKENLLPTNIERTQYRDKFIESYPFLPEVIDCLYNRWGSLPTFQRTRGVLRILAIVIYLLKDKKLPYISIADFDLSNQELRDEIIKHIGQEFNSVIGQDITEQISGSKKIDVNLGNAYKGLSLATRAATTIFMHSFSGGPVKGISLNDIKRISTLPDIPSSVINEAIDQMKNKLFYFQFDGDKYFFSSSPNINKVILDRMENIKDDEIIHKELELLRLNSGQGILKVYIWEKDSNNIQDDENLKLIILEDRVDNTIKEIFQNKGLISRVNINTIVFLVPLERERTNFHQHIRKFLALKSIEEDKQINLDKETREKIISERKSISNTLRDLLHRYYRTVIIPVHNDYHEYDLGVPTHGESKNMVQRVYERLRDAGKILDRISPELIQIKYLNDKEYLPVKQLINSFYRTPDELMPTSRKAIEIGIFEGVEKGNFGLGVLENDKPVCKHFKEKIYSLANLDDEIIINEKLCKKISEEGSPPEPIYKPGTPYNIEGSEKIKDVETETLSPTIEHLDHLEFSFKLPVGKTSNILSIFNYIQKHFRNLKIKINATEGKIPKNDYDSKILEAFRQAGIDIEQD